MFELYLGNKFTGFAVCHDDIYPEMWRVHYPSGHVSDMINLTRAKDAALVVCKRSMAGDRNGGVNVRLAFNWKARGRPGRERGLSSETAKHRPTGPPSGN